MQLFGSHIAFVAVVVVLVLLPTVLRRLARRAGKAAGSAKSVRQTATTTAPPAGFDAPVVVQTTVTQTKGELGVGKVLSLSSGLSGPTQAELELDAIGAPKRRVSAAVPAGLILERGDRIYVLVDPGNNETVSILPTSMTGGQALPKDGNRLDALVLGPQILRVGKKAKGIVKTTEPRPLANEALAAQGMSKWYLELEVQPEQGWPYRAELVITLSTPEKATRIAHAGAEVLLRYDPEDQKTVAIDSIAMGYGDPYTSLDTVTASVATTGFAMASGGDYKIVLIDGGDNKIHAIKTLREVRPDLSLKDAKDIIESQWETSLLEVVSESQAQTVRRMFEKSGARVEVRQGDIAVSRGTATAGGNYKVVLLDGGNKKVNAIRTLREVRPDLSLKDARDMIESRWETSLLEGVSESQAQEVRMMFERSGARVDVRQA